MRKKVDSKIQTLITNIIALHQRGFFIIVGDRGRDQVVNLHYLLCKHLLNQKPKVLWCYKKELGFSSHHQKRMKEVKKQQQNGTFDTDMDNPFELFISSNEIRYCYYKESQKILGNTFQMLVLQDFESITPNILCRTIETISGGGLVIMLIKTMKSLKQLYSIAMDVHQRYRTDAFQEIVPRFNERFLLSLSNCKNTIIMDDELNILPLSSLADEIVPQIASDSLDFKTKQQLKELQESMKENNLVGPLIKLSKTLDQAKAGQQFIKVMMFVEAIVEKNFRQTISLTAGRGRVFIIIKGKSAAIGLSVAAAVQCGFSNIFVSAPTPENLKTFFEFVINGLEALGYKENLHFDILQSTNQEFQNCVIRININKTHRQFVQFIFPNDCSKLNQVNKIIQADLLIVDEAASIPINYIKDMLGPYVVFLSSTINGYEGTGRSLSLKLITQIREQNRISNQENKNSQASGARLLKEITLQDPIRYSPGDPLEAWLNSLLLLDATQAVPIRQGLPHPDQCELFLVNRDTLFSYHKSSEQFLFNMMSLFISSHYKNSPNDLQLLSDAPGHSIFVLMEKQNKDQEKNIIPDILCIVQIAFEGQLQDTSQQRGVRPAGDLIPWVMQEQYQDDNFPKLQGGRIVRIATHPQAQKMGYGRKTLEILSKFFEGKLIDLNNDKQSLDDFFPSCQKIENVSSELLSEELKPKKKLKPLLKVLSQINAPRLDYLGVSFGLTPELFKFWKRTDFNVTYLRQTKNDITAEHSCIMIKVLKNNENDQNDWSKQFYQDFKKRFSSLLSFDFKQLLISLCLGVMDPRLSTTENQQYLQISKEEVKNLINLYDLKRMESYGKNLVDYHLILDLIPIIANLYFQNRLKSSLAYSQAAILLGIGLQHKNIDSISEELQIPVSQSLALFNKAIRKVTNEIKQIYTEEIEKDMPIQEVIIQKRKNK